MVSSANESLKQWQEGGGVFSYEGHLVFYRDSGANSKPVMVLLHGFPTSSWDWREIWPDLVEQFRVICLDFIGFGLSDKPNLARYSIMLQADVVESLLHVRGVVSYHLLSHDYGDTVAQELIARDIEHARGLIQSCVLLNGGLFPETHKPLFMQKLLLSPIGSFVSRFASFRKFVSNFDSICMRQIPASDLKVHWDLLLRARGRSVMPKIIRYMDERVRYRERWVSALTDTKIPLRLINGLDDPISGGHMADRYQELVNNADIVGLPAIGHYPQNENPRAVIDAAQKFWNRVIVTDSANTA